MKTILAEVPDDYEEDRCRVCPFNHGMRNAREAVMIAAGSFKDCTKVAYYERLYGEWPGLKGKTGKLTFTPDATR